MLHVVGHCLLCPIINIGHLNYTRCCRSFPASPEHRRSTPAISIVIMSLSLPAVVRNLAGPSNHYEYLVIFLAASSALLFFGRLVIAAYAHPKFSNHSNRLTTFGKFFYASFLKPHSEDASNEGQQAALESFYKAQVSVPMYPYHVNNSP